MKHPPVCMQCVSKAIANGRRGGRRLVLDNVSLELSAGETIVLLGPNGAGKSTLLSSVLGLVRPDHGRIQLYGHPPDDPHARRHVGYLPERTVHFAFIQAGQALLSQGRAMGLDGRQATDEASRLARALDLPLSDSFEKYSAGMRQRLGLALSLIHRPGVLVLDEPMNHLDPDGQRMLIRLLAQHHRDGGATLMSTHNVGDAGVIYDRAVVMHDGAVIADRPRADIESLPTRWLLKLEAPVEAVEWPPSCRITCVARNDAGAVIELATSGLEATDVAAMLMERGVSYRELSRISTPLREYYDGVRMRRSEVGAE